MLTNGYIAYALVEVRGADTAEISDRMAAVAEIASLNHAVTDTFVSGFIILSRGTVPLTHGDIEPEPFFTLLLKIQSGLKENVRIAYATEFAAFGQIGVPARFAYTFIAPSFPAALAKLLQTEFGKITELA